MNTKQKESNITAEQLTASVSVAKVKRTRTPKPAEVQPTELDPFKLLVDEFGDIYNRIIGDVDRMEKLKKAIAAKVKEDLSDNPVTISGYRHHVDYTAPVQTNVCTVTPAQFIEITGCWEALSVSVTKAKENLPDSDMQVLFKKERGSRSFKRVR